MREERAARDAAEREILALKTEKRLLEYRVINAHRTLAHGLGRAIIEAKSLKGMLALPGRIRRLRAKQKAKRLERVPNSFQEGAAAILRLVDPALEMAERDGVEAAVDWVEAEKAEPPAKARALAELAHWTVDRDTELASHLGEAAAVRDPGELRLFPLVIRLSDKGLVRAPAAIIEKIRDSQPLSAPQQILCDWLVENAAILERGSWDIATISDQLRDDLKNGLEIVCPTRWTHLPRIASARATAVELGLPVSIRTIVVEADLSGFAAVHIFADSLQMACSVMASARSAGCRVILDLANPTPTAIALPDSELARVEAARLQGLSAGSEALIARSQSAAQQLSALGIAHLTVGQQPDDGGAAVDDAAIAAAMMEYEIKDGLTTLGIGVTLDEDPGIIACLDAVRPLVEAGKIEQILVFGTGDHLGSVARHAEAIGLTAAIIFIGLPSPQRWPTLLEIVDLLVFPRQSAEVLGSEVPMLLVEALARNKRILAGPAAWADQAGWQPGNGAVLENEGDWSQQIGEEFGRERAASLPLVTDDSWKMAYKALCKPL